MLSLCLAGVLLADSVIGSAFDMGTVKLSSAAAGFEQGAVRGLAVQTAGLILKLSTFAIVYGLAFATLPYWRGGFSPERARELLGASGAAAFGMLLLRTSQVQMQLAGRFRIYGLLDLCHAALRLGGVAACIALARVSPEAVLLCFAGAPLTVAAVWAGSAGLALAKTKSLHSETFTELFLCVKWFLLTFGLAALLSRLDLLMLSRMSNLTETGIFSAGQVFALVPQMLGTYASIVLSPKIMPWIAEGRFFHRFRQTQLVVFASVIVSLAVFQLLWYATSSKMLPHTFARSGAVIQILVPGALAGMATFPLTLAFLMFHRPRFLFLMDCVSLPILVGMYAYFIPLRGAVGAAWVTTFAALSRASIAQAMAWKWARQTQKRFPLEAAA